MKCVSLIGRVKSKIAIIRVRNEEADRLINNGDAHYVSKSVWKKYGRKFDTTCIKQANESALAMRKKKSMENKK